MDELFAERERIIVRVLNTLKNEHPGGVQRCNEYCLFLLRKLALTNRVRHLQGLIKEHMHTGTSVGSTLQEWMAQGRPLDEAMAYLALWPTSGGKND
jgi:hypothetical protein